MSMNAERARSAFAESAGEINQQLSDYQNDVENIKGQNKNLKNTFKTAKEMEAIRDVASEAGVRALKEFGGKYLKSAYEYKIPKLGKSVADLDGEAGKFLEDRVPGLTSAREGLENLQGQVSEGLENFKSSVSDQISDLRQGAKDFLTRQRNIRRFGRADPESETEMTDLGSGENNPYRGAGESDTMGARDPVDYSTVNEDGSVMGSEQLDDPSNMMGEAEDTAVEGPGQTFEEFMNQFTTPKTETGDIDFQRADDQLGMGEEDMRSRQLSNQANTEASERDQMGTEDRNVGEEPQEAEQAEEEVEMPWDGQGEVTEGQENLNENVRDAFDNQISDDVATDARNRADATREAEGEEPGEGLEDTAENLGEEGAEEGGELAGEEGAVGGLEGVGTALDATGVFAPLGALFNLAGLAVEGFTAYEAGKGVYDWVKDDVLGHGEGAPQIRIPHPQKTLAQQGLMVIPTTDSIDTQQTVMGW